MRPRKKLYLWFLKLSTNNKGTTPTQTKKEKSESKKLAHRNIPVRIDAEKSIITLIDRILPMRLKVKYFEKY